jgi:hypothetical protein
LKKYIVPYYHQKVLAVKDEDLPKTVALIQADKVLNVELNENMSEDELLTIIADRVDYLLQNDKDLLLSHLYRLDISQRKINHVLKFTHIMPAHLSLAQLILSRQKERVATKKNIKVEPLTDGWEF